MSEEVNRTWGYLVCPSCMGELSAQGNDRFCVNCDESYSMFCGRPVMLTSDNSIFSPSSYVDKGPEDSEGKKSSSSLIGAIKRWLPPRSVNLSRSRLYQRISGEIKDNPRIMVVGCGNQKDEVKSFFDKKKATYVFTDIDHSSDCDVFCDGHHLPFRNDTFDLVLTTAVMEHVMEPWIVSQEIKRVTKTGGLIYSEVPFLQGVHEGAYDFTRFTLGGHRALYPDYDELDAGAVAGPGTALVWTLTAFIQSLLPCGKLAQAANFSSRFLFSWIRLLDRWLIHRPIAQDFASCTYFYGVKREGETHTPISIIERYEGRKYSHFND
ncbi:class I SAM-dependent methyltransferase [Akkermansiaceae bacterium]|nr:class I SAM-dependent methyltransferase [Akkermansiaceae bacterium]